jgi:hypothetical protein
MDSIVAMWMLGNSTRSSAATLQSAVAALLAQ